MNDKELQKEQTYINKVRRLIKKEQTNNKSKLKKLDDVSKDSLKYMWNERNLDPGEIANLKVFFDQESAITSGYFFRNKVLDKMYPKPFFSRIDFKIKHTQKIYIGFSSIIDKNHNLYVYDWRSPVASMYYDFEKGAAHYNSPDGKISGEIISKKQYKIEDGKLTYLFESNINIEDDILKEAIGNNNTEKMKDIVNTIQKEQNQIIRNKDDDVLLVEGPAGCGKTSVGLHRIAFLLYQYRKSLQSNQVLIFSPNNVFTDYIDEVLPSLGEQNALTTMFSEYMDKFIEEYKNIEPYTDFIERVYQTGKNKDNKIIETKMDDKFKNVIDEYLQVLAKRIKFENVYLNGSLIVRKKELYTMYKSFEYLEPYSKLDKIVENTVMKLRHALSLEKIYIQEKIRPKIRSIVKKSISYETNVQKIFIDMFQDNDFIKLLEKEFKDIDSDYFSNKTVNSLEEKDIKYEDAIIFLYFKAKLKGAYVDRFIKQVVIDEGQDYNKMQYYIINKTFKKAEFIILGDANQIINPVLKMKNLNELKEIFKGKQTNYLKLKTSYRNTFEITNFANNILDIKKGNPIDRHGPVPEVVKNLNFDILIIKLKQIINNFNNSNYNSLAIILKNVSDTERIVKVLEKNNIDIGIYNEISALSHKIIILPIYYAKGLEFDEVCIIETKDNRFKKGEEKLFYVAATRPLHKLTLLSEKK